MVIWLTELCLLSFFFRGTFHNMLQTWHTCTYSCIGTSRRKAVQNPHERVLAKKHRKGYLIGYILLSLLFTSISLYIINTKPKKKYESSSILISWIFKNFLIILRPYKAESSTPTWTWNVWSLNQTLIKLTL